MSETMSSGDREKAFQDREKVLEEVGETDFEGIVMSSDASEKGFQARERVLEDGVKMDFEAMLEPPPADDIEASMAHIDYLIERAEAVLQGLYNVRERLDAQV